MTPDLNSYITTINLKLAALDYEIRSTRHQTTREHMFALVNTSSDAFTQLATTFTPDEIAYVKRVLDAMFEENNSRRREILAVSGMQARQLAKAPRSVRQSQMGHGAGSDDDGGGENANEEQQSGPVVNSIKIEAAEAVLEALVQQDFFAKSRAEYYSLAPRALLELRTYLKSTYNDPPPDPNDPDPDPDYVQVVRIRDCHACAEIVTVGLRCVNRDCGCRLHDGCTAGFFRGMEMEERKCPICRETWTGEVFVGERAVTSVGRRSGVGGGRRAREIQEEEEDD
jgi:non-structural maintenance of chromosomes element 1